MAAQVSVMHIVTGRPIVFEEYVCCKGVFGIVCPIVSVTLDYPLVRASTEVAVVDNLPFKGMNFILSND